MKLRTVRINKQSIQRLPASVGVKLISLVKKFILRHVNSHETFIDFSVETLSHDKMFPLKQRFNIMIKL